MQGLAHLWHQLPPMGKILLIGTPVILVVLLVRSRGSSATPVLSFLQASPTELQGVPDTSRGSVTTGAGSGDGGSGSGQPLPVSVAFP